MPAQAFGRTTEATFLGAQIGAAARGFNDYDIGAYVDEQELK